MRQATSRSPMPGSESMSLSHSLVLWTLRSIASALVSDVSLPIGHRRVPGKRRSSDFVSPLAPAEEVDRQRERDGEPRQRSDLGDEVAGASAACLELGGDDQDAAYNRNESDEQERFDEDPAAQVHEPKGVEQLRDDEHEQDAVEDEGPGIRDLPRTRPLDHALAVVSRLEDHGHDEQLSHDDVDADL